MQDKDPSTPQLREHVFDGIQEYDQKLPNWWLFTFYIAIAWFVIHWLAYYQLKTVDTDENILTAELAKIDQARKEAFEKITDDKLWEMSQDPKIVEAGRASFMTPGRCVTCHGEDLMAKKTHPDVPTLVGLPLADTEWKYGGTPTEVLKLVRKGSPDLTKGMPPWEPALGAQGCIEVTAFIMSTHKKGEPITLAPDAPKPGGAPAPGAPPPPPPNK
jgi:cytochrome c oxidase cbb3-type subunit 3